MDWQALGDFLMWPGWAGVSGVVALLALLAALFALLEFALDDRLQRIDAAATQVKRSLVVADDMRSVTVLARPMGPTMMYEPEWIGYGVDVGFEETVPVLTVRDEPLEIELKIPRAARLDEVWVGLQWVEVTRTGIRARAFRTSLEGGRHQRWKRRPTWLGRRIFGEGRWIESRARNLGGPER